MLKLFYSFILLLPLLIACKSENGTSDETVEVEKIEAEIPEPDTFNYDTLKGMYMGDFGGSDIRIILNYVSSRNAIGYNIHKGLQRNLNGKVTRSGDSITLVLNEPDDNKFDGVFTLLFMGEDQHPKGNWEPNNKELPKRNFQLDKLVAQGKKGDEITVYNFTDYFGYMSDTMGNYNFLDDGLCMYEYYPKTDYDERVEQLVQIKGSWSLDGKTVTIEWQPNDLFPKEAMEFKMAENEWGEMTLVGRGMELYNYMYGP